MQCLIGAIKRALYPFEEAHNEHVGNEGCQWQEPGCPEFNVAHSGGPGIVSDIAPIEFFLVEVETTIGAGKDGHDGQAKGPSHGRIR